MKYFFKLLILIILFFFITNILKAKKTSDKIINKIENELILESEIPKNNKILDEIIFNKFMKTYANNSNFIYPKIDNNNILSTVNLIIKNYIIDNKIYYNNEYYKIINSKDLIKYIYNILIDNNKIRNYYLLKIKNLEIYPKEIIDFYKKNIKKIPNISQELEIKTLTFYPRMNLINKNKIINKLKKIKNDIENKNFNFNNRAILFSEDENSMFNGGLIKNFELDKTNKFFDKKILKLKEGEISDPFESNVGFHLLKIEKIKKNKFDIRNILIKKFYTKKDIEKIENLIFFIKNLILKKKININNIINNNSIDFNEYIDLIIYNSNKNKFKIYDFPYSLYLDIKKSKNGDILLYKQKLYELIIFTMIIINNNILQHKISFNQDYQKIKIMVDNYKISKKFKNFIKSNNITINN